MSTTKNEEQLNKDKANIIEKKTESKKEVKEDKKDKPSFIKIARVLKKPVITEKSAFLSKNNNEYVFKVKLNFTKVEVRKAIEELYNVKVESVNTIIRKGKAVRFGKTNGTRSDEKIAIVKIKKGQSINIY